MKEYRKISELHNWDKNPRAIKKEDFERLKKQIKELGEYKPLLITPDGVVLGGNMRLRAYKELGFDKVWVSVVEPKTEAEKVKYALSDNDRAGYYVDLDLTELVQEYGLEINLDDYKIDLGESISLTELLNRAGPEIVEDEPPEVSEGEAESKLGEVYQLGRHRLMCGDATKIEDVEKLMDGAKADMVFTDPPYGIDYVGGAHQEFNRPRKGHTIQNDLDTNVFKNSINNFIVKLGGVFYVCAPVGQDLLSFLQAFMERCYLSTCLIWSKNSMTFSRSDYHMQHETILYGWDKNGSHQYYGDRKQTTIWNIDRPSVSKEHPTMKPIALIAKAINNSSKSEDIVLDLFGGSGSTLIACEQTNRTCYMMELDPKYCDVIRKRYENYSERSA